MRTTLTIDDDVAAALEGLRRTRNVSLKNLINEALRRGLQDMKRSAKPRERFSTRTVALGRVRIGSLDDISEALAIAESECCK
jgi:Ribbon-helix-helix protein, copG family